MSNSSRAKGPVFLVDGDERQPEAQTSNQIAVENAIVALLKDVKQNQKPSYHRFLEQRYRVFMPWASANSILCVCDIKPTVLRDYRLWRQESGVSPGTARHDEFAVKKLTAYCEQYEMIDKDPLARYKPIPLKQKTRNAAEDWEIDKLLKVIEKPIRATTTRGLKTKNLSERQYVQRRDRMVVLTMLMTGARSGEVLSLTKGDLHREGNFIDINKSGMADTRKNGRNLQSPVEAAWWSELDAYLATRPVLEADDLLFPSLNGLQIPSQQWAHRFAEYRADAGVTGISSHCIRYNGGEKQAEVNGALAAQRLLGQESAQSTERYIRGAAKDLEWLREKHDLVSPLTTFLTSTGRTKKPRRSTVFK